MKTTLGHQLSLATVAEPVQSGRALLFLPEMSAGTEGKLDARID
jgi:hypothetical protein